MKINKNLWIEGGYYVDFDAFGQFRIIGPNNHLYCGLIDIPRHKITINSIQSKDNVLQVDAVFNSDSVNLYYPAMDDMRTVRVLAIRKTFLNIREEIYDRMVPQIVRKSKKDGKTLLKFKRVYGKKYYQTIFEFGDEVAVKKIKHPFAGYKIFTKSKKISFSIKAKTNDINLCKLNKISAININGFNFNVFGKEEKLIKEIWNRTEFEIKHLLEWKKTSGDRFGTIFPRDWMEAADLGYHDLTPEVKSYMYEQSLKNISGKGKGWHEDVVGEFKHEYEMSGKNIFDRHMIDIEPHYLIGVEYLPQSFWLKKENREKMRLVAKYVLEQADKYKHIIFKKNNDTGNWRDSGNAFRRMSKIIAPFDVNAVFYPRALFIIRENYKKLGFQKKDFLRIDAIYNKWKDKKKEYKFRNKNGKSVYALALYWIKKKEASNYQCCKLKADHLDESYLYAYGKGSKEDLKNFCERLLDPQYFYTKSGPLLVAKNNKYFFNSTEYHGTVIWIKQTAFVVLGLSKHLKIAIIEEWPADLQKLIKKTILKIAKDTLNAIEIMDSIPEVYADKEGKPVPFFELAGSKNEGSEVQLWSAVGIRRIIRKYYELLTDEKYREV
ncbi:MAG: hypothetical protein U9N04_04345 [Patescibacteria group bacterium]|nr:hypothetical protein [Patescibacteria group bacterium]